ncbi:alpha/beta hydrolase fold domain-containing protein [Decorospora gaudefroyi]|uniref:Alpha/beta hydrolase fold domain-containing protein n=1 Tax=Decorospora gaudefroyi TaxID=184978 RepID=A0A6A5KLM8_9PLEO|nr:alpha/beta hydrolase fold domain-containing protein [Decorospora gaudefroyi]
MQQENERMKLEDGRTLSYAIYGSPVPQKTVFYLHGFQSSRYEGKLWHSVCAKHHVRLIAPDRPGNGRSSFQTNRRILDWPTDLLALAEHLKVHQFYMLGVSGGAPYALACVKEMTKERLLGVSIASGLYPVQLGTAGMVLPTRLVLWVAPWMTGLTTVLFGSIMGKASRTEDGKVFEDMLAKEVDNRHAGDRDAIKDPVHWPTCVAMARESFHQGSEGASWEARLNGSEWGFELGQLYVGDNGVPLTLWHGTEDSNCPVAMAQRARDLMPGSVLYLKEGDAHVSFIFRDADDILEDLVGEAEPEEYKMVGAVAA